MNGVMKTSHCKILLSLVGLGLCCALPSVAHAQETIYESYQPNSIDRTWVSLNGVGPGWWDASRDRHRAIDQNRVNEARMAAKRTGSGAHGFPTSYIVDPRVGSGAHGFPMSGEPPPPNRSGRRFSEKERAAIGMMMGCHDQFDPLNCVDQAAFIGGEITPNQLLERASTRGRYTAGGLTAFAAAAASVYVAGAEIAYLTGLGLTTTEASISTGASFAMFGASMGAPRGPFVDYLTGSDSSGVSDPHAPLLAAITSNGNGAPGQGVRLPTQIQRSSWDMAGRWAVGDWSVVVDGRRVGYVNGALDVPAGKFLVANYQIDEAYRAGGRSTDALRLVLQDVEAMSGTQVRTVYGEMGATNKQVIQQGVISDTPFVRTLRRLGFDDVISVRGRANPNAKIRVLGQGRLRVR